MGKAQRALQAWQRLCRRAVCAPIRAYSRWLSPCLGRNCRFTPSCSRYAVQAIETHGCIKGGLLTLWRLLRCQPFGRWGYDPVPLPGRWQNPQRALSPAAAFGRRRPPHKG